MSRKHFLAAVSALLFCIAGTSPVLANDFDQYCGLSGFATPLRQTIIVLDENQIYPETGPQPDQRNMAWRRFLGNVLLSEEPALEQAFLPRERVAIVIARRDGTGLRPVFSGCIPFFSADEKKAIAQAAGHMQSLDTFFGTGIIADAKKDMDLFRIRFGDSVRSALQPSMLSASNFPRNRGDLSSNGLVASLKQGTLANLAYGIPRILIYSDMSRFLAGFPDDRVQARQMALKEAQSADLDLKDAELYVAGMSANPVARDALEMFFLASHGELMGVGSAGSVPAFISAPVHLVFYQGLIQYPDNRFPVRIRLATDQNGTAVNSWISVQTGKEQFNPIHGVVTCQSNGPCVFTGDDIFSQMWNVNRGPGIDPFFDQSMPFAGARSLGFVETGGALSGSISDTLLRFQGVKGYRLEFNASRQSNARF